MNIAAKVAVGFVAFIHIYILWLEAFAWESRGPKVFRGFPKELFAPTKAMAQNQGLYNGFLAAGLIWSLVLSNVAWAANIASFFLICVAVAGLVGAVTADKKILAVQTLPASIGLALIWLL